MQYRIRKRSKYVYEIPAHQISAFLELAHKTDKPIEELILEALDKYIETEVREWQEQNRN